MRARIFVASVLFMMTFACFSQSAAFIVFVSGNAQIVGKDGQARAAIRGGELDAGETIDTADGRVQLRFHDGANMSLQPATRFRVDEFRFSGQNDPSSSSDRGFFSLLKGGFRTITGLIGKSRREQYRVDAVVATIGIRGTDYGAKLSESGLELSTFGGLVELCNNAGCALVEAGETFIVSDRDSLPRRDEVAMRGGTMPPLIPTLPPPTPVEYPEAKAPAQIPQVSQPMQGPNYSTPTGPYR